MSFERASPELRQALRSRLKRAGYDVDGRCSLMHRALAESFGVLIVPDQLVDDWLYNMGKIDAAKLLHGLT